MPGLMTDGLTQPPHHSESHTVVRAAHKGHQPMSRPVGHTSNTRPGELFQNHSTVLIDGDTSLDDK